MSEATDTSNTTDARLKIRKPGFDFNNMLLDGIESVKLDGRTGQDTIEVGSLLNTDIQSLDLELGSDLAKMWSVQRNVDGTHQVFPANYGATEANPGGVLATRNDLREGLYFYRFDLAENGHTSSMPMDRQSSLRSILRLLFPVNVKQTQSIALADGLDRVVLFYGYDDTDSTRGYRPDTIVNNQLVPGNSVEIHAGMTAQELETALESLSQIDNVSVTGIGTTADPWIVTLITATQTESAQYKQLAQRYQVQAYLGALAQRDDTRVAKRFYRVADPDATYLYEDDGNPNTADMPVLVEKSTPATLIEANRVQFVAFESWELTSTQNAILWYGDEGIVVQSGDTAATIKDRLESLLDGVSSVIVLGAGTTADPWSVEFLNADKVASKYRMLQRTTGGGFSIRRQRSHERQPQPHLLPASPTHARPCRFLPERHRSRLAMATKRRLSTSWLTFQQLNLQLKHYRMSTMLPLSHLLSKADHGRWSSSLQKPSMAPSDLLQPQCRILCPTITQRPP